MVRVPRTTHPPLYAIALGERPVELLVKGQTLCSDLTVPLGLIYLFMRLAL